MPAAPTPYRDRSRLPLAGMALAAMGGILLADGVRLLRPGDDDGTLGWVVGGGFLALAVTPLLRRGPWRFWAMVATGYAALHFFNADPLPAAVLAHALDAPPTDHFVCATGTVVDIPRVSVPPADSPRPARGLRASSGTSRRFLLELDTVELDHRLRWNCHATVTVDWRDGPRALDPGDRLQLVARAANILPPRNPGEFDHAAFLRRRGVRTELSLRGIADGRVIQPGGPFQPLTLARAVHDGMQNALCLDLRDEPEVCAVVATMLLGLRDRPGLGTLEPMFQRTGTLHFFAIDGLKLGLLAFLLLRALDAAGLPKPWAGLFILPLLLGYALATGLGAASARAVLVAAVLVGGEWLDRPARPLNSLGAAAAVLLLFDTNQLFELNFQLSFSVVLAILTLAGPIDGWLQRTLGHAERMPDFDAPPPWPRRVLHFLRRHLCGLTAVSVAAWLGSIPLMLLNFHVLSPLSPLANVAAFPLAFTVLSLGVFSLAGAFLSQTWVAWMNNANWLAAKCLLVTVHAFDTVPGGSVAVPAPEHWRWGEPPPALEMVVLDAGRARAGWMRAGGSDWLLDCARPFDYFAHVRPCLGARAVQRLDGLLITQEDPDHLGALPLCRTDFLPASLVLSATNPRSATSRALRLQLAQSHAPTRFARRGDALNFPANVTAQVLYPPDTLRGQSTAADRALALRFDAAGWRVWWMAEGDRGAARWLLSHDEPDTLRGDVLVTAAPVSADWLQAVNPRLVILRPPSTQREKNADAVPLSPERMFTQEDSGAVTLEVYPDRMEARGFVDGRKITIRK